MQKVVLASQNSGKLKELATILLPLAVELIAQSNLNIPEVDEPYSSFVENALHKARHAAKLANLPGLADDSGICVDVLNGAPGIYSARYAGEPKSDLRNIEHLLANLAEYPLAEQRSAYFYCVIVFVRSADDPCPIISSGKWRGQISKQIAGQGGFGYDPIFYLPEYQKTVAELSAAKKNKLSHRAQACQSLIEQLAIEIKHVS